MTFDFLQDHRHEFFLATKSGERSGDAARAQLEQSLERLGVDRVDLIQLHNLVEPHEWETAFAPDGAVAALFAAVDEGLAGAVGVTGHGLRIPSMHLQPPEGPFASVCSPGTTASPRTPAARDVTALTDLCVQRGIAMQTIKSVSVDDGALTMTGRFTGASHHPGRVPSSGRVCALGPATVPQYVERRSTP